MKNFEMANSDDPKEIIMASQRSIIRAMKDVVNGLREETMKGLPGMTWEQIEYLLDSFEKKEPEIIIQKETI